MRVYSPDWDYTITSSSLPYGCLNKPNVASNPIAVWLPFGGALTRGINGLEYTFHEDNYDGCFALKFSISLLDSGYPGLRAFVAQYASLERCPAVQMNWDGYLVLGWALYGDDSLYNSATDAAATRDFNGQTVAEAGTYTMLMVKRQRSVGAGSEVAVVLTAPSGTKYRTNWFLSGDPYNRNQLVADSDGSIPNDYAQYIKAVFGRITVADQLSYAEAEEIWRVGDFNGYQERVHVVPDSSSNPAVGAYAAPVELSVVGAQSDGWVVRYTTDGSDPRSSSTPASFDLPTDLTYGSERYIRAAVLGSKSFTIRLDPDGNIVTSVYMASLYTNVVEKIFLAPAGAGGMVKLVTHGTDAFAVYSNGGLYKLPINSPGSTIQIGSAHLIATLDETKAAYLSKTASSGSGNIVYALTQGVMNSQVLHTLDVVTGTLTMISDTYVSAIAKVGSTWYGFSENGTIDVLDVSTGTFTSTFFSDGAFNYSWYAIAGVAGKLIASNNNGIYHVQATSATAITNTSTSALAAVDDRFLAIDSSYRLLLLSSQYMTGETGQLYAGPVTLGAPLVIGSSAVAKFAAFNTNYPTSTPERGPIVYRAYDFAIVPPVLASVASGARYYDDVPLIWQQAPSPVAGTSIYYTTDGTDPQTSPTRILWAAGHKFTYMLNYSAVYAEFAESTLKARMYHAGSNTYSDLYEQQLLFGVAPVTVTPATGSFTNSFTMTWSCPTPGVQVVFGGLEGLGISGPQAASGSIEIEMSNAPLQISFQSKINAPELYGAYGFRTYWFYVAAPVLSFTSKLSGVPLPVSAASPSAGAEVRYTLDGSAPTPTSILYTTPVMVGPGQTFKAISVYNGVQSAVAIAEVVPEYQVREIATSSDGSNHHYYTMQQQLELTSTLGPSGYSLSDFIAVGSQQVAITDPSTNALIVELAMWNAAGITSMNTYAHETSTINFQPGERTHFWSRFGVSTSTAEFTVNANNWIDALAGNATSIDFVLVSSLGRATFTFTVASNNEVTLKLDARIEGVSNASTTVLGTLLANASPTLIVTVASGSLGVTLLGTTVSVPVSSWYYWQQEFIVNQAQLNTTLGNVVLLTHVETQSSTAILLKAPATPYCETKSTSTFAKNINVDFKQRASADDVIVTSGVNTYERPADAEFSEEVKALVINSAQFDAAFPGVVTTGAFDASVEFDYKLEPSVAGTLSAWVNQVSGDSSYMRKPELKLCLVSPGTPKLANNTTLADIAIQFDWSQSQARMVTRLRGASSSSATSYVEIPSSYNEQRAVLRIRTAAGDPTSLVLSATINGAATDVATVQRPNGNFELRLRRTFAGPRLSKCTTTVHRYRLQANCVEDRATYIVMTGANFMLRGEPTGFTDTAISPIDGSALAVYFNPTSGTLDVEPRGFEPSDGRLLVGVLESKNGKVTWVNTMYSRLIRFRTEVNSALTGGSVIGVGSNLRIEDGVVKWTESGFERSAQVGDDTWQSPHTHLDLLTNKYVVKAHERQRLNVTISRQA